MLLDRKKYSEFGYLNDDLSGDAQKDLLHKCMVVEQSIADGDFPLEEALQAYQLTGEDYENYIARISNDHIFLSLSGNTSTPSNSFGLKYTIPMYIDIVAKMLDSSFDQQFHEQFGGQIEKIKEELEGISVGVKQLKEKA